MASFSQARLFCRNVLVRAKLTIQCVQWSSVVGIFFFPDGLCWLDINWGLLEMCFLWYMFLKLLSKKHLSMKQSWQSLCTHWGGMNQRIHIGGETLTPQGFSGHWLHPSSWECPRPLILVISGFLNAYSLSQSYKLQVFHNLNMSLELWAGERAYSLFQALQSSNYYLVLTTKKQLSFSRRCWSPTY